MLGTLNNLLLLNNVDSNVQKVVTGLIVVVAASLQTVVGGFTGSLGGGRQAARTAGPSIGGER
jgi:ribose/xylose/arabinose/galactoside ABC-type transport system permease subunit